MSLNPFLIEYRRYANSATATLSNLFLSYIQRFALILPVPLIIGGFATDGDESGVMIGTALVSAILYIILRANKDIWTDRIAGITPTDTTQNQTPAQPATPNPSAPSPSASAPVKFCTNCGTKLSAGARFCSSCGSPT